MLRDEHVRNRVVVVFDVLRATTTIAAALSAGAKQIRVFDSLDAARSAFIGEELLCGETRCLKPPGFDLGNSPAMYSGKIVSGKTLLLSTTNGTRALVAAREAKHLFTAALVNARAVAMALIKLDQDVTLLCAGTDGERAAEDELGACAVIAEMLSATPIEMCDEIQQQVPRWTAMSDDQILAFLRETTGGKNVQQAGLGADINFAARRNSLDVVPGCDGQTLIIKTVSG